MDSCENKGLPENWKSKTVIEVIRTEENEIETENRQGEKYIQLLKNTIRKREAKMRDKATAEMVRKRFQSRNLVECWVPCETGLLISLKGKQNQGDQYSFDLQWFVSLTN